MDLKEYERLRELRAKYCRRIAGLAGDDRSAVQRTAVAYAAMRAGQCTHPRYDNLERCLDQIGGTEAERRALERLLRPADLPAVRRLGERYNADQLMAYILFCLSEECVGEDRCTPEGLSLLGAAMLDVPPQATVADICCGNGGFMVYAYPMLAGNTIAAFEPDRDLAAAAVLRASILGQDCKVLCRDVLHAPSAARFDRVFLHPPILARNDRVEFAAAPADESSSERKELAQMSEVWLYIGAAVRALKPGGKAAALVSSAALNQQLDRDIRQSYIRSGLVEAVILLPPGLLLESGTSCAVVVFSEGNKSVQLIDARGVAAGHGREQCLRAGHISDVLERVDARDCVICHETDLAAVDWSLLPTRYLHRTEIPNGVSLESVAVRIERGAQLSTAKLADLRSDTPTPYKYLRVADIQDGVVSADESAEYLKSVSMAARQRCMRNGTVVLSRLGTPSYKSGVATVADGEIVLAPGNVYLIDVDASRMDPYFLQAFLQSRAGVASLRRLGGTSAVRPIALGDLRKMIVPVPPLDVQRRIAQEYREASERCADLRDALGDAERALCGVYDEWSGDESGARS